MTLKNKAYTLIELVMAVSLLAIVLTGGTAIFYKSFRSSGISDIQTSLNTNLRVLDTMIESTLRYGIVNRISTTSEDYFRNECLLSGSNGVTGDIMVVKDLSGGVAVYSLFDGVVSSNSGEPISNPEINVTKLEFTWYCRSGVNDKMKLVIEAETTGKTGDLTRGSFVKDINLLNSGIN